MESRAPYYNPFRLSLFPRSDSKDGMKQAKVLRVYLGDPLLAAARAGKQNFCNRIVRAFAGIGYRVEFRPNTAEERESSGDRRGYSLYQVDMPGHENALTFRKAYIAPFWQIDQTVERWEWHVARSEFDPANVDPETAQDFVERTRERVFPDLPAPTTDGYIYIPLQGALTTRRIFQTLSPVEMIEATLAYDPRPIVVTLHPNEDYSAEELSTITGLAKKHSRLTLDTGGMEKYLPGCDMVVCENSAVAFNGYFLKKKAVLFSQIDFHHIASNVPQLGVAEAFRHAAEAEPAFDAFLFWYLQKMSINAGRKDAEERILAAVQRCGWKV